MKKPYLGCIPSLADPPQLLKLLNALHTIMEEI